MSRAYIQGIILFALYSIVGIASAAGYGEYAPSNVAGMTFYGNLVTKEKINPNIVLNFRAPLGKDGKIGFYPVSGPDMNTPKNQGIYRYRKIGPSYASLYYLAQKGLEQKTLFRMMLNFKRQNAGTLKVYVYHFKTNETDVNTPTTRLVFVKNQMGTFSFKPTN